MRTLALLVLVGISGCSFEKLSSGPGDGGVDGGGDGSDAPDALLPLTCPSGYGPIFGVGMYRLDASTATWQDAANDCNDDDDGGSYTGFTHLIVLADETERTAITKGGTPVPGNSWIGLSDLGIEGNYVWVTSEPTGNYPMVGVKPPWDTDDPDDAGGAEDCIRFKNSYVLEDKPCGMTLEYVCECDRHRPN